VYGTTDNEATATSKNAFVQFPYGVRGGGEYPQTLFQLQLCQPEQEYCETSGSASATKWKWQDSKSCEILLIYLEKNDRIIIFMLCYVMICNIIITSSEVKIVSCWLMQFTPLLRESTLFEIGWAWLWYKLSIRCKVTF